MILVVIILNDLGLVKAFRIVTNKNTLDIETFNNIVSYSKMSTNSQIFKYLMTIFNYEP